MGGLENAIDGGNGRSNGAEEQATEYEKQAEHLGQFKPGQEDEATGATQAIKAKFITPLDPVIETADGGRLPTIPVSEAKKLNALRRSQTSESTSSTGQVASFEGTHRQSDESDAPLRHAIPPSRTNPLFPPLPIYGPPTLLRSIQCLFFRLISGVLSFAFLMAIFVGAILHTIPPLLKNTGQRAMLQNPTKQRPFYEEEIKRKSERKAAEKQWAARRKNKGTRTPSGEKGSNTPQDGEFVPTEGGPDALVVDVGYYARRVGLDTETFEVQTEDGFIIQLWHIFNPREYVRPPSPNHKIRGPDLFQAKPGDPNFAETQPFPESRKKYPVLMVHGLLQSSGAFCCNEDDSLAFYLAKSGYDVWLGNNRCGFQPKHTMLDYKDPRMWAWNIRQMGVLDLPALISRVLTETGFPKLALIAHSQGTTEAFVALAKEQRPDIGSKISVFCALAPAVYAGPLISKIYFRVMRVISPAAFRIVFGIHAFIPMMMFMHKILPARLYSWLGYHVFSHLFNWTDKRWDRGLRNRMFQCAPVYVSSESMRWWLGRECFAKQRCILATREEGMQEDQEDEEDDDVIRKAYVDREPHVSPRKKLQRNVSSFHCQTPTHSHHDSTRGRFAWYDKQFPPLALWIAGADDLVDARRLLRRFDRGREPYVRVVHKKIIEGYEHLDVIWAMDAIEKVGKEVREVIWRTVDPDSAAICRVPVGCARPLDEDVDIHDDVPMLHSGGRLRMASISEAPPSSVLYRRERSATVPSGSRTQKESAAEVPGEHDHMIHEEKKYNTTRRFSEARFTDLQEKSNPLG